MNNVKWGQSSIHGWEMSGSALPAIISGHGGGGGYRYRGPGRLAIRSGINTQ